MLSLVSLYRRQRLVSKEKKMLFVKKIIFVLAIIFPIFIDQSSIAEVLEITGSCNATYKEYQNSSEYYKSFSYSYQGKKSVCGLSNHEDEAVKNCEVARKDNNYLSYYSKIILPPCQLYANSPTKSGSEIVWNEADFVAASHQFFTNRETKRKSGDLNTLLEELPLFMYREKLREHVLNLNENVTHWAIATTPKNCPTTWNIRWTQKSSLEEVKNNSLKRCNERLAKNNPEWSKFTNTICNCQLVMADGKLKVAQEIIPGLLTTFSTLYLEKGGKKAVLRGMLDYEIGKLEPQVIAFKSKDGQLSCGGDMNPSFSTDGSFNATCKGVGLTPSKFGGFRASGFTQVITSGKMHSIAKGKTDQGEKFAIVTRLMPEELSETYPEYFPKISANGTELRLSRLKELEDAGLITEEEAAQKRKAILDSL
jgi:hypothetical protein